MPGEICNFDLTHDLDIVFIFFKINKKEVNRLDTGLTAPPCPITTPMNLTFKFQIKACNNLISIIREPIDMAQAS